MAEGQSPELIEFISQLEIKLSLSGESDVKAALQEIIRYEKSAIKDIGKLKSAYGGLDGALKELVKRHKKREQAASKANKSTLQGIKKLTNEVKRYGSELGKIATKSVMPSNMGDAIGLTLKYNKSMLSVSASVNRLGIGMGLLEKSLARVGRETSLTRMETISLFDKYQESMRFVSLQQFEGMLKRIQSIVGSNAEEMGKYQSAIAAVSQAYPGLAQGLASLEKAGGGIASSEKAVLQSRIRNLYFIGKIKDAEYKRLTSFISGNQQIIGADKKRQAEIQAQIRASQAFKKQWEDVSMTFGEVLLPYLVQAADILKQFNTFIGAADMSAGKLALTFAGIYATMKIGGGALSALGGMAVGGRGIARSGGGLLSGLFGKRGGVAGKVVSGAGAILGADGTKVWVTNWPLSLGGGSMRANAGPQLPGKGGMAGKLGIGSRLGKLGKGLGIGALLGIGSWGVGKGAGKLESMGMTRSAGAAGMVGGGLGIGSGAVTGAAIGTFLLPGIGTAIGGALGGLVGVVKNWGSISEGFSKLFGKSDKEAKPMKSLADEIRDDMKKAASAKSDLEDKQAQDMKDVYSRGVAAVFGDISAAIVAKQKEVTDLKKVVDVKIAAEFEKKDFGTIESQLSMITKMKEKIAERGDYGGNKEQKKADEDALEAAEKRLKTMHKITAEVEKGVPGYKEITKELVEQEARLQSVTTLMAKYADLAKSLSGIFKTQSGYVDAIITRMSIAGEMDPVEVFGEIGKGLDYLDKEISAQRTLVSILNMQNKNAAIARAKEESQNKKLTKNQQAMFKEISDMGPAALAQLDIAGRELEANIAINTQLERKTELLSKARNMYADSLKLVNAQATGVSLLVQLADNYAIGVGASVQLREKEFLAQSGVIEFLRKRLAVEQMSYQVSVQTTNNAQDNKRLRAIVQETENEILQAQIKQASTVKSMRDAWISAISAMNIGMGGFSEIIMNAEQNTAMIQQLDGAVRSSVSGAFALRDAFGRIIEDVGHARTERMTPGGTISAPGRSTGSLSYDTGRRYGHDDARALELLLRGRTTRAARDLSSRAGRVGRGGPTALAAGANRYLLSSQTEGLGYTGTNREGFSFGGGVSSTYIGPPKAAKASPAFIVNNKSDAVPVFVVNAKDVQGGIPTSKDIEKAKKEKEKKKPSESVKEEKKFIAYKKKELAAAEKKAADMQASGIFPKDELDKIAKINKEMAKSENRLSKMLDPVGKDKPKPGPKPPTPAEKLEEDQLKAKKKHEADLVKHDKAVGQLEWDMLQNEKKIRDAQEEEIKMAGAGSVLKQVGYMNKGRWGRGGLRAASQNQEWNIGRMKDEISGERKGAGRARWKFGSWIPSGEQIGKATGERKKDLTTLMRVRTQEQIDEAREEPVTHVLSALRTIGSSRGRKYTGSSEDWDPESIERRLTGAPRRTERLVQKGQDIEREIGVLRNNTPFSPTVVLDNVNVNIDGLSGLKDLIPILEIAIIKHMKGLRETFANDLGQYKTR